MKKYTIFSLFILSLVFGIFLLGCGGNDPAPNPNPDPGDKPEPVIVCFGDDFTVGVGAGGPEDKTKSYPAYLQKKVNNNMSVINAGVNEDTTRSALLRVDADVLSHNPQIVIIYLGARDLLSFMMGYDAEKIGLDETTENLQEIINKINNKDRKIYLVKFYTAEVMQSLKSSLPPQYQESIDILMSGYDGMFDTLGAIDNVTLIPDIWTGVWGNPSYMSTEGAIQMYPKAQGYEKIANTIFNAMRSDVTPGTGKGISLKKDDEPLYDWEFLDTAPITVTVTNTGANATGELSIYADADDPLSATSFTITPDSISDIPPGSSATFTVKPNDNLLPNSYEATITVSGGSVSASFTVSYSIVVPVDDTAIDGLWYNENMMLATDANGTPGVWVFIYPNFWRLNGWGYAWKGTFTITGQEVGADAQGNFTATLTRKKDNTTSYNWTDSPAAEAARPWIITGNGTKLTIGSNEFTKTDWYAPENNATNKGPWQTKLGDPTLTAQLPPRPVTLSVIENLTTINGTYTVPANASPVKLLVSTTSAFTADGTTQEIAITGGTFTFEKASLTIPANDFLYLKVAAVVDGRNIESEVVQCTPARDCGIVISDFFGDDIIGTYSVPDTATNVKLVYSKASAFTDSGQIDLSGGTINVAKTALPANSLVYLKITATVGGGTKQSDAVKVHTGEFIQVNTFTDDDPYKADVGTTGNTITVSVADGIWSINYNATQAYNHYGRIFLSNVLDDNSKSISNIKGVYYKQKSTGNINETVTYVREDTNPRTFNVKNIRGVGDLDVWTEVLETPDYSNLDNTKPNRRLSIGMTGVGNTAGTLYIKDLYLIFDKEDEE
jgi:acyl-CoA thioesterase I